VTQITKLDVLKARLVRREGRRNKPYVDTVGKITIGIGWNLTDNGLPDHIIDELFRISVAEAVKDAEKIPVYFKLNAARKTVLIDMVFNMGLQKVLGFRNTLDKMNRGDFVGASQGMLQSLWATQVGQRADELAEIMRSGEIKNAPNLVE
jgi:lysozyme